MVILRPTKKLRSVLPMGESVPPCHDTALGDWYVNRIVVDRQPLLLLVASASLLPILVPARDVRSLPERLGSLVASRLRRLGVDEAAIGAEVQAMRPVVVGPTCDRSVLGIVVDFTKAVPCLLETGRWNEDSLASAEDQLARTPCHASKPAQRVIFPDRRTSALLIEKWLSEEPQPTTASKFRLM